MPELRRIVTPRWWRRLPAAAKNLPPAAYDHCAAQSEVMTPDAILRDIACGKSRRGHGRWHQNRDGVVWRGKWKRPIYMQEWIDSEGRHDWVASCPHCGLTRGEAEKCNSNPPENGSTLLQYDGPGGPQ